VLGIPQIGSTGIDASSVGYYGYENKGRITANNVINGTTVAFYNVDGNTADVVGVGVNFINNTIGFYLNGLLQITVTLDVEHRNGPLRAAVIPTSAKSVERGLTCNFKGPFFALPSGFVAYDWENTP
jgi:hypothetical protein